MRKTFHIRKVQELNADVFAAEVDTISDGIVSLYDALYII